MHELIEREITDTVKSRLKTYPAVALLGARQAGKSTIAGMVIEQIQRQSTSIWNVLQTSINSLTLKLFFLNSAIR